CALRDAMTRFVAQGVEAALARVMPDLRMPAFLAGYRVAPNDVSDVIAVLTHLRRLGLSQVGPYAIDEALPRLMAQVQGGTSSPFASYRIAETLAEYGPFEGNP